MNVFKTIIKVIGLNREKPKTRAGRIFRWAELGVAILVFGYLLLLAFPQVLFSYSISEAGITLYARQPFPDNAGEVIRKINAIIDKSELQDKKNSYRIFICNSQLMFTLFSPVSRRSFGISSRFTNHIFLAQAEVRENLAFRYGAENNKRAFHTVAAHEIVHVMIRKKVGTIKDYRLPRWISEGYCEYVSADSSFPEAEGVRLLISGGQNDSASFRYFVWRKMVEYLIDAQGYSFARLIGGGLNPEQVKREMVEWLKAQKHD
ncbi:MAG: hypothetical protein HZA49_00745 [Planctomycetes bacterium]|nr:hypothetical protein [Planctomycetota bacterium]